MGVVHGKPIWLPDHLDRTLKGVVAEESESVDQWRNLQKHTKTYVQ